jgi:prepilin-type N-terminal cleavage/methylation domain-containing protein
MSIMTEAIRQKTENRGFSLLEVLIATVVFAITAMGLVALNKVSMDASVYGRERTAASNLAQFAMTWLENEVAAYAPGETPITGSFTHSYLKKLRDTIAAGNTGWVSLSGNTSLRFDEYLSNETDAKYAAADTARYCIHYRVLFNNGPSSAKALPGNLYHASVMVTWPMEGGYVTDGSDWTDCANHIGNAAAANGAVPANYHSLMMEQILTRDFANKVTD